MKEPIRIFSDLHIGHPMSFVTKLEGLRPLLNGARTIVFNGDTVEMRFPGERVKAQETAATLGEMCRKEGAEPVFLNGNHDPDIAAKNHIDLCDGRVLVMHGDAIFRAISPWSPKAEVMAEAHSEELDHVDANDFEQVLMAAKRAALSVSMRRLPVPRHFAGRLFGLIGELWPPRRPIQILKVWYNTPTLAAQFVERYRPAASHVIIGHVHAARVTQVRGRWIINTGSFLPAPGRLCVDLAQGELRVRAVERRRGEFRAGKMLHQFRAE